MEKEVATLVSGDEELAEKNCALLVQEIGAAGI